MLTNSFRSAVVIFAVVLFVSIEAAAQNASAPQKIIGSLDGQPLQAGAYGRGPAVSAFRMAHSRAPGGPADEQELTNWIAKAQCDGIRSAIAAEARSTQKRLLGTSAPPQEVQALKAAYLASHDLEADAKKEREDANALVTALTEVYEHGMDQQKAYETYLAPRKYLQAAWQGNLNAGSTAEGRAQMRRDSVSAAWLAQALDGPLAQRVEREHLNAAVDAAIASSDPTFRTYLDEEKRGTVKTPLETKTSTPSAAHDKYLRTKRAEWWAAREAEVRVVLFDASIAQRCGIKQ
jgi:hypothetical protein